MRYAICLHGQPRDYNFGYKCISEFIKNNNANTYDFFIHCWIDENKKMSISPWRNINEEDLYIKNAEKVKQDIRSISKLCDNLKSS